jgi:predicted Fe-Mo cluster-binding NifX family protein
MKIAVSAEKDIPDSPIDLRFGRAKYFVVYNDENMKWEFINNIQNYDSTQGAGIQSAATVANNGCTVLISGHCGPKAFATLFKAGVTVYKASGGTVREAIDLFRHEKLIKLESADVDGHW